jgi:hypothetical protein
LGWLPSASGFTLLSDQPAFQISFQYTAHWTAFLFPVP